MADADGISGGGRIGGPSGGGSGGPPLAPEDIERIRQTIRESIERLTRFEDLMRDFLASGIVQNLSNDIGGTDADDRLPPPSSPQPIAGNYADQSDSIRSFLTGSQRLPELHPIGVSQALGAVAAVLVPQPGSISRQMLSELGNRFGTPSTSALPDSDQVPAGTGPQLSLVGGSMAGPIAQPQVMQVQIAPELRLNLDRGSKWVSVERLEEDTWVPTQVMAMKDGRGGVEIDTDGLEQELGALSQELREALNLEAAPPVTAPKARAIKPQIGDLFSADPGVDPSKKADFVDADGQAWVFVSFLRSDEADYLDLEQVSVSLADALETGVNLVVDIRDISAQNAQDLKDEVERQGWSKRLKFWP